MILLRINPHTDEVSAHTIMDAARNAVGNRGTVPELRNSKTMGTARMTDPTNRMEAKPPKKLNGLSVMYSRMIVASIRIPSR